MEKIKLLVALCLLGLLSCAKANKGLSSLMPLLGDNQAPVVLFSIPAPGQFGIASTQPLQIYFSKEVDSQRCTGAFALSQTVAGAVNAPIVSGSTSVLGSVLTFLPSSNFSAGTYNMSVTSNCEDKEGRDLQVPYSASFTVGAGGVQSQPTIVAVGLESQGAGCSVLGSVGSASGANWTSSTCFWDSTLPILGPSSYQFQGGDNGTGTPGNFVNACADVNTDNFILIFNNYMNPSSTVNAITLTRLSPPPSSMRLATWTWSDCQTVSPYGCRAVDLVFSELEASCNGGSTLGPAAYGPNGDFNLQATAGSPAGFPRYMIQMDTTARDIFGRAPISNFNFAVEGK